MSYTTAINALIPSFRLTMDEAGTLTDTVQGLTPSADTATHSQTPILLDGGKAVSVTELQGVTFANNAAFSLASTDYTVVFWANITGVTSFGGAANKQNAWELLFQDGGGGGLRVKHGGTALDITAPLTDVQGQGACMFAVTYRQSDKRVRLYRNGAVISEDTHTAHPADNTNPLCLLVNAAANNGMAGTLDDTAIFKSELTEAQIKDLYALGLAYSGVLDYSHPFYTFLNNQISPTGTLVRPLPGAAGDTSVVDAERVNHGVLVNTASYVNITDTPIVNGPTTAIRFTGADYADLGALGTFGSELTDGLLFSAFVKFDTLTGDQTLISVVNTGDGNGFRLYKPSGDSLSFEFIGNSGTVAWEADSVGLTAGAWGLVEAWADPNGDSAVAAINSTPLSLIKTGSSSGVTTDFDAPVLLGAYNDGGLADYMDGDMIPLRLATGVAEYTSAMAATTGAQATGGGRRGAWPMRQRFPIASLSM